LALSGDVNLLESRNSRLIVVFKTYYLVILQILVHGEPGEKVKSELILRVVTHIGLIVSLA